MRNKRTWVIEARTTAHSPATCSLPPSFDTVSTRHAELDRLLIRRETHARRGRDDTGALESSTPSVAGICGLNVRHDEERPAGQLALALFCAPCRAPGGYQRWCLPT